VRARHGDDEKWESNDRRVRCSVFIYVHRSFDFGEAKTHFFFKWTKSIFGFKVKRIIV